MEINKTKLDETQIYVLESYLKVKNNPELVKLAEELSSSEPNQLTQKVSASVQHEIDSLTKSPVQTEPVRIFMDGVFDIIHSGHFNAIRQAKKLGGTLVIGVNSSYEVEMVKGPPLMNDAERTTLVSACKWVDEVVSDVPYTVSIDFVNSLKCDYVAHGDDMPTGIDGKNCYEAFINAGRMKIFKRTEGISTTDIVGRLLTLTKNRQEYFPETMIKSSDLVKELETEKISKISSKFLTTGWRLMEFSNKRAPTDSEKVVYIHGDFDILHTGHIQALEEAKKLGDFVYVGLFDDMTVNNEKGANYPILNLQERTLNLLSLKYVDDVVISAPTIISENLIKSLKIDIVAVPVGENVTFYEKKNFEYAYEQGIAVELTVDHPLNNDFLVDRVFKNREAYAKKFEKKSKSEKEYYENKDYDVKEI